jgi:hypothetical protein
MDIDDAIIELDEITEQLERDAEVVLTYDDLPCLLKALAALESCRALGGR